MDMVTFNTFFSASLGIGSAVFLVVVVLAIIGSVLNVFNKR